MQWRGPFTVLEKVNPYDYKIKIKGKIKTFHDNMLKKNYRRNNENEGKIVETEEHHVETIACVSVIDR